MIRNCRDQLCFPAKRKSLLCQIQMNMFINNNDGKKRRKYNKNTHKAIRITDGIYLKKKICLIQFEEKGM